MEKQIEKQYNLSSLKVVISQAVKHQNSANSYWANAWKQAVALAGTEHRNLSGLNLLAKAVHETKNMQVMPLIEAVLKIGGQDKTFKGMIGYSIKKHDDGRTEIKFHATQFKGEEKTTYKDKVLVSKAWVMECAEKAWWDIAKPEKITPPVQFKVLISAIKRLDNAETVLLTAQEKKLLNSITELIVKEMGSEVFESGRK